MRGFGQWKMAFWTLLAIMVLGGLYLYYASQPPAPQGPQTSILFLGNSFTAANDLPGTFSQLARWGGHPVSTGLLAEGGFKLYQHAARKVTQKVLTGQKWDYVVLQEQSQVPSMEIERNGDMYPAVRTLNDRIRAAGATPILFVTWGRKKGCPEIGYQDYGSMQDQLIEGYKGIAKELGITMSPVGVAWKKAVSERPELELWDGDGIHPSPIGTYLAACVFYAVLYGESPEGIKFHNDLPNDIAVYLQKIAKEVVLTDPTIWNIPKPIPTSIP